MNNSNGVILWEGPSALDGAPIVVIATGLRSKSNNRKTGGMIQTYILRRDLSPVDAVKKGEDSSICGNCPHRGDGRGKGRTCYVNLGQGPRSVWDAYQKGRYPHAGNDIGQYGEGRLVRVGTYGDPAAVPAWAWQMLLSGSLGHTGYTHQWRYIDATVWAPLVMASCDSEDEASAAQALGWRTFRVSVGSPHNPAKGEVLCPASDQAGKKLTCEQCGACNGTRTGRKGSIWIPAHGGVSIMANFPKLIARLA